ncbi:MAG: small multi-drug export protein [Spirochaetales bacterium]|uniref:Small multi-drug export protein n=1 Tax=Candidatus Thalassospirochaeta sargassi TaxID=3119039 RepID=A0AAJ1IDG4_9SPIO|nr:small multi-drug export protein [Spirochaetales bacterium]
MDIKTYLITAAFTLLPISELRGAIPYAVFNGIHPLTAYFYCVILNAALGPLVYLFLDSLHKLFYKMAWYRGLFDRLVTRARHKVSAQVDKYGYLGIMLFVGIPLPITGAYTGTLGAWILGLDRRKTCLAVAAGAVISGIIVSLLIYFGTEAASIFTKQM